MGAGAFLSWFSCKVNKSFCGVNIVGEYLVDFFCKRMTRLLNLITRVWHCLSLGAEDNWMGEGKVVWGKGNVACSFVQPGLNGQVYYIACEFKLT